jgi:hypothetical protein
MDYLNKYSEFQRQLSLLEELYNWKIINNKWQDSFHSPKDIVKNIFRISYELKETLKNFLKKNNNLKDFDKVSFYDKYPYIAQSIDISNQEKHWKLNNPKSNCTIWIINTGLHLLNPYWKDKTNLTIEIDNSKVDCLNFIKKIIIEWENVIKFYT